MSNLTWDYLLFAPSKSLVPHINHWHCWIDWKIYHSKNLPLWIKVDYCICDDNECSTRAYSKYLLINIWLLILIILISWIILFIARKIIKKIYSLYNSYTAKLNKTTKNNNR